MNEAIKWQGLINGQTYDFSYQKMKGSHTLTVNGEAIQIKAGFMSAMFGFDEEFKLDGQDARLVIEKNKPDIILNGIHIQSGKPYIQRPKWVLVFAILCLLIPVLTLGGVLPLLLGFAGAAICVNISKTSLPMWARLVLCIAVTIAAWVMLGVFLMAVSRMY